MLGVLREAATNAARHAGVEHDRRLRRGRPDGADRLRPRHRRSASTRAGRAPTARGSAESIVGRAERAGGKATVVSRAGRRHRGRDPHPEDRRRDAPRPARARRRPRAHPRRRPVRADPGRRRGRRRIEVVGEADSVEDAVAVIRATRPDVVLLDVHLPGGGGHAVIEGLRGDKLDTRYLALSVSDAADDVIGVVRAGARGYVTKTIARRRAPRGGRARARRRRRVLAPPRRVRARRLRQRRAGAPRSRARPAHRRASARSCA